MFKNHSAVDIVVIIFSLTVGIILVVSCLGILAMRLVHPEVDVTPGVSAMGRMVEMLVTALIGFVGGRAQGKYEASNGVTK